MKFHEHIATEPEHVSPREYVQACLDLVNWRQGDDMANVLVAVNRVYGKGTDEETLRGLRKALKRPALKNAVLPNFAVSPGGFAEGLRKRVESFLFGDEKKKRALRSTRDAAVDQVTTQGKLHLGPNGELIHQYHFISENSDAKEGLLLAYLFAPNMSFGRELRNCPFCQRYFLSIPHPNGGPPPKFCPGTDHARLYDDKQAAARVKKRREIAVNQPDRGLQEGLK